MAEDIVVVGTLPEECVGSSCPDSASGVGLLADRATLEATRFEVADAALAGVIVAPGSEMDLSHGVVARCPIGANVQAEGYALERLQDDVRYVDNGRALDATTTPVPRPTWGAL